MKVASYFVRVISLLLFGLGAIATPFVLVYLMGAIGTGGKEAVGELFVVFVAAVIGIVGGLGAWRIANAMSSRSN